MAARAPEVRKLKALLALLVVANLLFFGWSSGAFDALIATPSLRPDGDREPERLRRQVRPETIVVLPADAAASAPAVPAQPAQAACLEAGPFASETELAAATATVQAIVAPGELEPVRAEQPGVWLVYIGRYATDLVRQRRLEELRRRGLDVEPIDAPEALAPGLELGRFPRRDAADEALADLVGRGARSARVVALAPPTLRTLLRVARAEPATAARLAAIDPVSFGGQRFVGCAGRP